MNPTHKLIFTFFVSEPHIKELFNIYQPIEQKGFFYYRLVKNSECQSVLSPSTFTIMNVSKNHEMHTCQVSQTNVYL